VSTDGGRRKRGGRSRRERGPGAAGRRGRGRRLPAVFADRDGTLNHEVGYLASVERLRLIPGTAAAARRLRAAGFAFVVVTNQSGVARGLMTEEDVRAVNAAIVGRLGAGGAPDAVYYCPHHPDVGAPPLRRRCRCRKPGTGLVRRAVRRLDLDLARSYCVGDGAGDVVLAAALGVRAVLVLTGHGRRTRRTLDPGVPVAHVAANFRAAVKWIIDDARRRSARRRR